MRCRKAVSSWTFRNGLVKLLDQPNRDWIQADETNAGHLRVPLTKLPDNGWNKPHGAGGTWKILCLDKSADIMNVKPQTLGRLKQHGTRDREHRERTAFVITRSKYLLKVTRPTQPTPTPSKPCNAGMGRLCKALSDKRRLQLALLEAVRTEAPQGGLREG